MSAEQMSLECQERASARRELIQSLAGLAELPDAGARESNALLDEMAQLMLTARGDLEPLAADRGCASRYLSRMVEMGLDEAKARCGLLGPAVVRGMILNFDPESGCSILFPPEHGCPVH